MCHFVRFVRSHYMTRNILRSLFCLRPGLQYELLARRIIYFTTRTLPVAPFDVALCDVNLGNETPRICNPTTPVVQI